MAIAPDENYTEAVLGALQRLNQIPPDAFTRLARKAGEIEERFTSLTEGSARSHRNSGDMDFWRGEERGFFEALTAFSDLKGSPDELRVFIRQVKADFSEVRAYLR